MKWPEQPTCHSKERHFRDKPDTWREPHAMTWEDGTPSTYAYPFRSCSYCGSIHPEDLLKFLREGATLGGADWKYGWPHKFYVSGIQNPIAGQQVAVGMSSHTGPIMDAAPAETHAKWYNTHLQDDGFDDESRSALLLELSAKSGIVWNYDAEKGVGYSAPYKGFQKP